MSDPNGNAVRHSLRGVGELAVYNARIRDRQRDLLHASNGTDLVALLNFAFARSDIEALRSDCTREACDLTLIYCDAMVNPFNNTIIRRDPY